MTGGAGGVAVGCNDSAATFANALSVGYGVEPFWYGIQMPTACDGPSASSSISLNTTTAKSQGESQASLAKAAASSDHIGSLSDLYYDLEGFVNNSGCLAAAQAFVNGWSDGIANNSVYNPGLYGSSCSSYLADMSGMANIPTAIAPSDANVNVNGEYGLQCLPDTKWDHNQRLHQSKTTVTHTFNGTTLTVDEDCVDGPVFGNLTPSNNSACSTY